VTNALTTAQHCSGLDGVCILWVLLLKYWLSLSLKKIKTIVNLLQT